MLKRSNAEESEQDSKKVKLSSSTSHPEIDLILSKQFRKWSTLEVASVLCLDEEQGGAGLSESKLQPFLKSSFDGSALYTIAKDLQSEEAIDTSDFQKSGVELTLQLCHTCKIIVYWVRDRLSGQQYLTPNIDIFSLLDRMKPLNESPLPYKYLNYDMKYVQRKAALGTYTEYVDKNLEKSDPKEGRQANVLFIGGSPGVGKSRFAFELPRILEQKYNSIKKFKIIDLAIWFSNIANFSPIELENEEGKRNEVKKPKSLMRSIVSRMIYSYITHVKYYEWPGITPSRIFADSVNLVLLDRIFTDLGRVVDQGFLMRDLLMWIAEKEKEEGKTVWIHFTLDEYNQVIRSISDDNSTIFDDWINTFVQMRGYFNFYFTSLFTGTHMQDCKNLASDTSGGMAYMKRIELLNFSKEEQEEIYENEKFPKSIAQKTLFKSLGGHARLIAVYRNYVNEGMDIHGIIQALGKHFTGDKGSIMIGLELDDLTLEILILLCLTRYPIPKNMKIGKSEKTLKQLQRCTIMFFKEIGENLVVKIPLLVLRLMISGLTAKNPKHFLKVLGDDMKSWLLFGTNFELFEEFNQKYLVVRLQSLQALANYGVIPGELPITNLFSGVSENFMLNLEGADFKHSSLTQWYPHFNNALPNTVYKNGDHAPFADIFVVFKLQVPLFFYIQVRHSIKVTSRLGPVLPIDQNEIELELIKLENARQHLTDFWGEDTKIIPIFITNRPSSSDVSCTCISTTNHFSDYFGPFTQILSYLGRVEFSFFDMSDEDINFILSTDQLKTQNSIKTSKTHWKDPNIDQSILLFNNFSKSQLDLLWPYVIEKEIFTKAINKQI